MRKRVGPDQAGASGRGTKGPSPGCPLLCVCTSSPAGTTSTRVRTVWPCQSNLPRRRVHLAPGDPARCRRRRCCRSPHRSLRVQHARLTRACSPWEGMPWHGLARRACFFDRGPRRCCAPLSCQRMCSTSTVRTSHPCDAVGSFGWGCALTRGLKIHTIGIL